MVHGLEGRATVQWWEKADGKWFTAWPALRSATQARGAEKAVPQFNAGRAGQGTSVYALGMR